MGGRVVDVKGRLGGGRREDAYLPTPGRRSYERSGEAGRWCRAGGGAANAVGGDGKVERSVLVEWAKRLGWDALVSFRLAL